MRMVASVTSEDEMRNCKLMNAPHPHTPPQGGATHRLAALDITMHSVAFFLLIKFCNKASISVKISPLVDTYEMDAGADA
jgi:hypothetical protein